MKSFFFKCINCRSSRQEILFPAFHANKQDIYQNIVMCCDCGAIFRNPVIPDLRVRHYETPSSWSADTCSNLFERMFRFTAEKIASNKTLKDGDFFLDIGPGPGWLTKEITKLFPHSQPVLLEPGAETAKTAKRNNPGAIVIPAQIDEACIDVKFPLIIASGVDYLFSDARACMNNISEMMTDDGVFYIQRNVFVDQQSYWRQPIYDLDDLFGLNSMMNFWPNKDQFIEYLGQFFTVKGTQEFIFEEYTINEKIKHNADIFGVFCTKGGCPVVPTNYYDSNMAALKERAYRSSVNDLSILFDHGVRTVSIVGDEDAGIALRDIILENKLFTIDAMYTAQPSLVGNGQWKSLDNPPLSTSNVFLVASAINQESYCQVLRNWGIPKVLPCLRSGTPVFTATTSLGNKIQMKAFLPAMQARLYPEMVIKEGVGATEIRTASQSVSR